MLENLQEKYSIAFLSVQRIIVIMINYSSISLAK